MTKYKRKKTTYTIGNRYIKGEGKGRGAIRERKGDKKINEERESKLAMGRNERAKDNVNKRALVARQKENKRGKSSKGRNRPIDYVVMEKLG